VTRHKSRQFNFSLHVKINHIEFEDKFLIKRTRMWKIVSQKTVKGIIWQVGIEMNKSLEQSVQQNALQ